MSRLDRSIAGISCRDVLADLSQYVDDELEVDRLAQIRAHVAECQECERFGGAVAELVQRLRSDVREPPPLDEGIARRLRERLQSETGRTG